MTASVLKNVGILLVLSTVGTRPLSAGSLDAVHVRAKADAPREADQPGYEVNLFDTHSEIVLVGGAVYVPDAFGKVDAATLELIDPAGQRVGYLPLAPAVPPARKASFEFHLKREYLKNSTVSVIHMKPDSFDMATFHLGTFEVRELKGKPAPAEKPAPPVLPKVRFALAEQGVYGEHEDEFVVTDKVPFGVGQRFGLRLYLRGDGRSLPLRVEQTLPAPPKSWGDAETLGRLKISADGRTASETRTVATNELIHPGWTIADGDPEGDYEVRVFVRDELVKTFVFHVRQGDSAKGNSNDSPPP